MNDHYQSVFTPSLLRALRLLRYSAKPHGKAFFQCANRAAHPDCTRLQVILDSDLAAIYGVTTKRLNEQLRRNRNKFPSDFAFQLTKAEWANLRLQIVTSSNELASSEGVEAEQLTANWSQIATSSSRHRGATYTPWVFTEHGALQAGNILNSPRAVAMSVYVIRAFVKLREQLAANHAILMRLADIYEKLLPLLTPPPEPPRPEIGFHIKEDSVPYRIKRKAPHARPPTF